MSVDIILEIPKQLQDEKFRFIKIKKDSKIPEGTKWQYPHTDSNYSYNEEELIEHIKKGNNIGICGGFNNLLVYDFDDIEVYEKLKDVLPDTFTIKTGGKSFHFYYFVDDFKSGKIVDKNTGKTLVDIQGAGRQVVTVPSLHMTTKRPYEVYKDIPICEVKRDFLNKRIIETIPELFEQIKTESINEQKEENDSILKLIKERLPLLDYLKEIGFKYNHYGAALTCPFCNHNGCFSFNRNIFQCFSASCERTGNLFYAYMYKNNCSFPVARNHFIEKLNLRQEIFNIYEKQIKLFTKETSYSDLYKFIEEIKKEVVDNLMFLKLLDLIAKQTKKPKKLLADQKINKEYSLVDNGLGYRFTKEVFNPTTMNYDKFQISDFQILEKQKLIDYNVFNQKEYESHRIFIKPALKKEQIILPNENEQLSFVLNSCKNKSSYCIMDKDTEEFIKLLDNVKTINKHGTTCHCYMNKKYYEPKEFEAYRMQHKKEDGDTTSERESCYISENYEEFLEIKYTENKIKKIIDTINKIPRDEEEREIWKIILSWSVSSVLKMELHRLKSTIYPYLIVIGDHDTGKTKINEVCVLRLWNNENRPTSDFGGVAGARLVNLPSDIRPICYQEVEEFPKNWIASLKEAMTAGKFTLSRGMKHGRYELSFYQNIAIDTNDFSVTSEALENRAIFLYKEQPRNKEVNNSEELNYLLDNIHLLGKYLYDNFKNLDTESIWQESKNYINKEYITEINKVKKIKEGRRTTEKLSTIRFGETILEHYNILTDVKIDYHRLHSDTRVELFNREKLLREKIQHLLLQVQFRYKDSVLTLSNIFHDMSILTGDITRSLKDIYGIVFFHDKKIGLSKNFLSRLNTELEKNKQKKVMNLPSLAKELKLVENYKVYNYLVDKQCKIDHSILCVKLDDTFYDYDETPKEESIMETFDSSFEYK